jgi:uncharacterized protein (TIGR02596 family)
MKRVRSIAGFSLVELLTVVGLIVLLMAIALPVFVPLTGAARLSRATTLLSDTLNLARQTAMTRNADVELRFYKLKNGRGGGGDRFRAFQAYLLADPAHPRALDGLRHLPDSVIILDDASFSTLLDHANPARSGLDHGQENIPAREATADYVSFRFRPAGGTTLTPVTPPNDLWYLTLGLEAQATHAAPQLPANYATIQVEPVTGRVKVLRP